MMLAAGIGLFGLLLLAFAVLLLGSLRKNRLQLRRLRLQVEQARYGQLTPAEREALRQQLEEVEAQKRVVFGRYENAGG